MSDGDKLKVAVINRSDATGGAAVVSRRLTQALRRLGADARMVVAERLTDEPFVSRAASPAEVKRAFLAERLEIFAANGLRRDTLFKIDTASAGLPLWRHPDITEADVICLNWVNQGMLSFKGLRRIFALGKPVIWTMHDMWNMTGVCHHAGDCKRYLHGCGECPLMGFTRGRHDISASTFRHKKQLYENVQKISGLRRPLTFVAVSHWMGELARQSLLLRDMPVEVIPNAFPIELFPSPEEIRSWRENAARENRNEFVMAIGAARLDDPIKGLPLLIEATRCLRVRHPELADRTRLVTFGTLRDAKAFDGLAVAHTHLGRLAGTEAVRDTLRGADAIISSSLYETLPGTLVEGQACGAIPVSFDRGGQADIIDHLHTGYLAHMENDDRQSAANLAEGIVWAASAADKGHLPELLSRSVSEKFSSESVGRRFLDLFQEVLC